MGTEQNAPVKSADRVLDLFELLAKSGRGISHSNIAERLDIPKSSLTPLLRNLVARGYIMTGPDGRSYQLGPQLLQLVRSGSVANDLAKEAGALLQQATRDLGETSAFNQLHGDELEVVATVVGRHRLITHMKVGETAPLYATSGGKAMLALMSETDYLDYLKRVRFEAATKNTIVSKQVLDEEIREIKRTGIAYSREEWTPGIIGIAIALQGADNFPVGSANFAIPALRYDEDLGAAAAKILKRFAHDISRLMGDQVRALPG
ncbi:IclR family transcriptional regulator protein (plasmid) [Rhizobium phaseoli]|uniref:IclR family transcriptional regulator n=1 Tax=Rhizobium phaseoli TaxID=396 RepID=UPI0007EB0CF2|nr:IclR family transcriptional regulator [Rhizobium phaseoli]ANL51060.1 IclR family transcriptional regulator protein [Rhizobium phaseoli]